MLGSLNLDNFDKNVSSTIVARGRSYWKNGHVRAIHKNAAGFFEAIVEGSDDYTVQVNLTNRRIGFHTCSCPYDWGPVCKHEVAVFFKLKNEHTLTENASLDDEPLKVDDSDLEKILKKITPDDLFAFVIEHARQDAPFRNKLVLKFAPTKKTKKQYLAFIKNTFLIHTDNYGVINPKKLTTICEPIWKLIYETDELLADEEFTPVINLCEAIIEQVVPILHKTNDEEGELSSVIERAFELLYKMVQQKEALPPKLQRHLYEYCLQASQKEAFKNWEWKWDFIHIAADLIATKYQQKELMNLLDKLILQKQSIDKNLPTLAAETAARIKLGLIKRFDGRVSAEIYERSLLHFPTFRENALQKAFFEEDFELVKDLAAEGIEKDQKAPGLKTKWTIWMLKVAQAEKDQEDIVEWANTLFHQTLDLQYLQLIKRYTPPIARSAKVDELINTLKPHQLPTHFAALANIYIAEHRLDDLLALLKKQPTAHNIRLYEHHLLEDYTPQLIQLYNYTIQTTLEQVGNREHYRAACQLLERMAAIGGTEPAKQLIASLKATYSRRSAMLQELNRLEI